MSSQPPQPLNHERRALSYILNRLMKEEHNLETLCKHAPRLVAVAINAARVQAALERTAQPDSMTELLNALNELDTTEEEPTW